MTTRHGRRQRRVKLLSAVIGGSAVLAMGALAVAFNVESTGTGQAIMSGGMSTGVTVTETTPDSVLATAAAVPPVKAKRFGES